MNGTVIGGAGETLLGIGDTALDCRARVRCNRESERRGTDMISDPIEFELFKNALFGVADEMALTVFRTTYSGVLKDNMDYSTAMFDGKGVLVAQGLTLPGHLGSMPTAMAAIQAAFAGRVCPGDVFILNDPFQGGMHLPDGFIFKPIFETPDRHCEEPEATRQSRADGDSDGARLLRSARNDESDVGQARPIAWACAV